MNRVHPKNWRYTSWIINKDWEVQVYDDCDNLKYICLEDDLPEFWFVKEEDEFIEPAIDIVELMSDTKFVEWKTTEELCESVENILRKYFTDNT